MSTNGTSNVLQEEIGPVSHEEIVLHLKLLQSNQTELMRVQQDTLTQARLTNGRVTDLEKSRDVHVEEHKAIRADAIRDRQGAAEMANRVELLMETHRIAQYEKRQNERRLAMWISVGMGVGSIIASIVAALITVFLHSK